MDFEKSRKNMLEGEGPSVEEAEDFLIGLGAKPEIEGEVYGKIILKLRAGEISPQQAKVEAAKNVVQGRVAELAQMGNNDSEFDIRHLVSDLESGVITPEEAIAQANGTLYGKQDWSPGGH